MCLEGWGVVSGSWIIDATGECGKAQMRKDLCPNSSRMPLKDLMHGSDNTFFAF